MIEIIKTNKALIAVVIICILTLSNWYISQQNKKDIIADLQQQVKQVTPEEAIIKEIKNTNAWLIEIWRHLEILDEAKRNNELLLKCYKQQLDRAVWWLEFNIEYCKDNIESFRGLN